MWPADPFSKQSRRAIVAHAEVDFGIARMYELMHGAPYSIPLYTTLTAGAALHPAGGALYRRLNHTLTIQIASNRNFQIKMHRFTPQQVPKW